MGDELIDEDKLLQSPDVHSNMPDDSEDLGPDPDILLGTPSPVKSVREEPMETVCHMGDGSAPAKICNSVSSVQPKETSERAGCSPVASAEITTHKRKGERECGSLSHNFQRDPKRL